MDMTRTAHRKPPILIDFVPIYWEPLSATGEKVVALLALKANLSSSSTIKPAAYVTLSQKRLVAMLGTSRGTSAAGILQQSANFLTHALTSGLDISDALPPFDGFSLGKVRRSSGWSMNQVLHSAVTSVSVFGSSEDMTPDEPEDERHIATTRHFISKIRSKILDEDKSLKDRFNRRLTLPNAPDILIDYGHNDLLVQVASLPSSKQQEVQLQREAESKLAELKIAVEHIAQNSSSPTLLVNAEVLNWKISAEATKAANDLLARLQYFAKSFHAELIPFETPDEAVSFLKSRG